MLVYHRCFIERVCWMKPKVELSNIICTLCNDKYIQDEYHNMVLKCVHFHNLGLKCINKYYYDRPKMYTFQQLMNTKKKKGTF